MRVADHKVATSSRASQGDHGSGPSTGKQALRVDEYIIEFLGTDTKA
ncbi:MAG: hypothetical protein ACYCYK_03725 [Candidatus Dormibacteria bacterium]